MQGNAPDEEYEDPHGECSHHIETLKGHINALLNQLAHYPVKHPQQADEREAALSAIT